MSLTISSKIIKNNLSINLSNQILYKKKFILIRNKLGDKIIKYNNNIFLNHKLPLLGATESHENPIHIHKF